MGDECNGPGGASGCSGHRRRSGGPGDREGAGDQGEGGSGPRIGRHVRHRHELPQQRGHPCRDLLPLQNPKGAAFLLAEGYDEKLSFLTKKMSSFFLF